MLSLSNPESLRTQLADLELAQRSANGLFGGAISVTRVEICGPNAGKDIGWVFLENRHGVRVAIGSRKNSIELAGSLGRIMRSGRLAGFELAESFASWEGMRLIEGHDPCSRREFIAAVDPEFAGDVALRAPRHNRRLAMEILIEGGEPMESSSNDCKQAVLSISLGQFTLDAAEILALRSGVRLDVNLPETLVCDLLFGGVSWTKAEGRIEDGKLKLEIKGL